MHALRGSVDIFTDDWACMKTNEKEGRDTPGQLLTFIKPGNRIQR